MLIPEAFMKKVLALILVQLVLVSPAFAAKKGEDKNTDRARAEQRKKVAERKEELNGSQWEVSLIPSGPGQKAEDDVLTFQNGQITSKSLTSKGFPATNYTITPGDSSEDWSVWETMQSGRAGVVFIRGEWLKEEMRGIISHQNEGKSLDYTFTTKKRVEVPKTREKTDEEKKIEDEAAEAASKAASSKTPAAGKAATGTGTALVSKESEAAPAKAAAPPPAGTVAAPAAPAAQAGQ